MAEPPGNWRQPFNFQICKSCTTIFQGTQRSACWFQNSINLWFNQKIMRKIFRSHTKQWEWRCSQYCTRREPT